jgi:UDP-glucose 4-epimerase
LLVTGGRGRLAALIADHFTAPAYRTELISRSPLPGLPSLDDLLQIQTWTADTTILHLAWSTLPATSENLPGHESQNDLPWLDRLLATLSALPEDRRPHLIFFSSGGTVYGNAPGRPSREDDACHPIGRYGRAKLAAEQLILAATARTGLPAAILRISNPYGYPVPGRRPQGIVPHAIRAAIEGQPLTLWGDGHARKDFLYHTDFLAALQLIVDRRITGLFNLASGASHRVTELLARVEFHTGRRITTTTVPAPAWDVDDSRLDVSLLSTITSWQSRVSLDEGIRRAVAGCLDH